MQSDSNQTWSILVQNYIGYENLTKLNNRWRSNVDLTKNWSLMFPWVKFERSANQVGKYTARHASKSWTNAIVLSFPSNQNDWKNCACAVRLHSVCYLLGLSFSFPIRLCPHPVHFEYLFPLYQRVTVRKELFNMECDIHIEFQSMYRQAIFIGHYIPVLHHLMTIDCRFGKSMMHEPTAKVSLLYWIQQAIEKRCPIMHNNLDSFLLENNNQPSHKEACHAWKGR